MRTLSVAKQHTVTLSWKGVPWCKSQEELDLRIEKLPLRAEELVKKTVKEALQGKAKIVYIAKKTRHQRGLGIPFDCRDFGGRRRALRFV